MTGTRPATMVRLFGGIMDRNLLILVARICLSAVYLYSGVDKLVCWNDGLKFCIEHKMPRPNVVLAITAIIHVVCGLMVLLGFFASTTFGRGILCTIQNLSPSFQHTSLSTPL